MIGDKITDLIPAKKLGIMPVLVKTGYGLKSLEELGGTGLDPMVVNDILDFADNIEKYNNVPFWILTNVMTFGGITNFYKVMKENEKEYIAKKYFRIKATDLENFMEIMNSFRNICAHDERLYDTVSKTSIPDNDIIDYFNRQLRCSINKKSVFSLLIGLCCLLSSGDSTDLVDELEREFDTLESKLKSIKIDAIYEITGFNRQWTQIKNI